MKGCTECVEGPTIMIDAQPSPLARFLRQVAEPCWAAGLTDGDLLQRFLDRRDEAAFAALIRRHGPVVLSVCRRVLHHDQDSEDAFQATFLVLVRNAGSIRKRQSVGSYLYGVARRVAVRAKADRAGRREREQQAPPRAARDALQEVAGRDLRAVLDEEVRRLPERCRLPFVLCYMEGKTNAEAARLLGCPNGTVLSRLARARELLRGRLARRGLTLAAGLSTWQGPASAALPASLVGATAQAALLTVTEGTGSEAVARPVRTLTEGMVQTMTWNKVKMTAALLLAVGLLAGGAGALVLRAGGADQPDRTAAGRATGPAGERPGGAGPEARRDPEREPSPAKEKAAALEEARAVVERLEVTLEKLEAELSEARLASRLEMLGAEEELHRVERQQQLERERDRANLKLVEQELRRRRLATAAREDKDLGNLLKEWTRLDEQWREHESQRSKMLLQARQGLLNAENRSERFERGQLTRRARERELQAAEDRLRRLEEATLPPHPEGGRDGELERKVDRLIREVTDLRREIGRRVPDKP
jgi:RNA polymerase sigma factor (sigma-70 family)